jgi:hypothetical protein
MLFLLSFEIALAKSNSDVNITRTLEVGSSEEAALLKELYAKYPDSRSQIDEYRQEVSKLSYGTKVKFHFVIQDGTSEINWKEVAAGAVVGVGVAVLWNLFGAEILCAVGVAPMCVCVGPQC